MHCNNFKPRSALYQSICRLRWASAFLILCFLIIIAFSVNRKTHTLWSHKELPSATDATSPHHPHPSPPPPDDDEYVAICMAVRDQSRDLPEVLTHHYHHLGIRRFYIMDDGSMPPLSLKDYGIPSSAVTINYFYPSDRGQEMQYVLYKSCIEKYGDRHKWIGFLDTDEYLEMTGHESLVSFLQSFDSTPFVGAVGVNWRTHTSSNILKRPQQGCRKAFTQCIVDDPREDNRHIKSFVKPQYYSHSLTPHHFQLLNNSKTVGENGDIVDGPWRTPITRERWALHHYGVRSKEEYAEKMGRGNGMDQPKGREWWEHIARMEHVDCEEMAQYVP